MLVWGISNRVTIDILLKQVYNSYFVAHWRGKMTKTHGSRRGGIGGLFKVNYPALVPIGYDARVPQTTEVKVVDRKQGGLVTVITELAVIVWEHDSSASYYPNHVRTAAGRLVPKDFVLKDPKEGQLLIIKLKVGARPRDKKLPKK